MTQPITINDLTLGRLQNFILKFQPNSQEDREKLKQAKRLVRLCRDEESE